MLPFIRFTTEIPASFTSGGIIEVMVDIRFCISTAAALGSVPGLKYTVTRPRPELVAVELA